MFFTEGGKQWKIWKSKTQSFEIFSFHFSKTQYCGCGLGLSKNYLDSEMWGFYSMQSEIRPLFGSWGWHHDLKALY